MPGGPVGGHPSRSFGSPALLSMPPTVPVTKEVKDRTQAPGLEQTYRRAGRCWPPEVTSPSPLIRSLPTIPIPPTPRVRRPPFFSSPPCHPPFFAAHASTFLMRMPSSKLSILFPYGRLLVECVGMFFIGVCVGGLGHCCR